jgi:hypothetical protein
MTDAASPEPNPSHAKRLRLAQSFATWLPIAISLVSLGLAVGALAVSIRTYGLYKVQVAEEGRRAAEEDRRIAIENTAQVSVVQIEDTDEPINGFQIWNDGPGIARLKTITYYVNKLPLDDVTDVIDYGKLDNVGYFQFNDNDTLAAGAREWLLSKSTKGNQKDVAQFNEFLDDHVAVEVEVCSDITGKCQTQCSHDGWCK